MILLWHWFNTELKTEEGYSADIVPTYILREMLCGHSADIVRILRGHCADIVRTLCGHKSPGIYVRTISFFGFQLCILFFCETKGTDYFVSPSDLTTDWFLQRKFHIWRIKNNRKETFFSFCVLASKMENYGQMQLVHPLTGDKQVKQYNYWKMRSGGQKSLRVVYFRITDRCIRTDR